MPWPPPLSFLQTRCPSCHKHFNSNKYRESEKCILHTTTITTCNIRMCGTVKQNTSATTPVHAATLVGRSTHRHNRSIAEEICSIDRSMSSWAILTYFSSHVQIYSLRFVWAYAYVLRRAAKISPTRSLLKILLSCHHAVKFKRKICYDVTQQHSQRNFIMLDPPC